MPETIAAEIRNGPIRVAIQAEGAALKLFTQKQQNTIIRVALEDGGAYFVKVFVPLRFSNYARLLGYHPSNRYLRTKQAEGFGNVPFVRTGEWRTAAAGAYATATAKKTSGKIEIKIPQPHPVTPVTSAQFRSVLPKEFERIALQVGKALVALLADRTETTNRQGVTRATLPATSRAAVAPNSRNNTAHRRAA